MSIKDVRVRNFRFPPKERAPEPFHNAILTFARGRENVGQLVEITTDEGLSGICPQRLRLGGCDLVEGPLRKVLIGEDPVNLERLWQKMYMGGWRKPSAKGEIIISSISAVDNALWDLVGKMVGLPIYKMLGGFRDKVPCYAAGGYYQKGKGIDELVNELTGYVKMGYKYIKMKVGGPVNTPLSLKEDVERVRAVREAVGDEIEIMLDANNAWTSYEAIRFIKEVEKYNPYWLEEPVHPDDILGCQEVKAATPIPISSGETEFTRWGTRDLIEKKAVDILQVDPAICGGYSETRKIAAMASAYHILLAPHGRLGGPVTAGFSNGLIAETYPMVLTQEIYNALKWTGTPAKIEDSHLEMSQEPGMGMVIDEEKASKYEVNLKD